MGPLVGAALRMGVADWESRELWELAYATRLDEHAATQTQRTTPEQMALARHRAATAGRTGPDPSMAHQIGDRDAALAQVAELNEARARRQATRGET